MKRLYLLTLCSIGLAACIFFFKKRIPTTTTAGEGLVIPKAWLIPNKNPVTPEKDCRPADQTFLTYPEWFLVFSPDEQAQYFKQHTASTFPYMSHTRQIWESYHIANNQIKDNFPTNTGYHFMIWVIGTSASVEYAIKAWYESTIGRMTDTYAVKTAEDAFNAQFAQDYVDFIKDQPWYAFDFKRQLQALWTETPMLGDHLVRKLERRYFLTSELLVKYGYGKLIGLGTKTVYDEALPTTAVALENDSVQYLPRYDKFAASATALAEQGRDFKEIAGNNSAILLTVLVPSAYHMRYENTQMVFTQPLPSAPETKRIALAVPVPSLGKLLLQLRKDDIKIEHIFDF